VRSPSKQATSSGRFQVTITPDTAALLKRPVREAIELLEQAYPSISLRVVPDTQGGAWVEMLEVPLGLPYAQATSFVIFLLPFNLPGSDIYPLFMRSDLTRTDGAALGQAFQNTALSWPGDPQPRPVIQVSRRTRGAFSTQTAPQKVAKVLDWIRAQ
jgi:hypothetical protein